MDKLIRLEIVSPEAVIVDKEVEKVSLPGLAGPFTVLYNHAPMIAALEAGVIRYVHGGETETLAVESGFAEISNNVVAVTIER